MRSVLHNALTMSWVIFVWLKAHAKEMRMIGPKIGWNDSLAEKPKVSGLHRRHDSYSPRYDDPNSKVSEAQDLSSERSLPRFALTSALSPNKRCTHSMSQVI